MMSRGFPNLFVMPAPGQQAVVTVNYTQLAVLGAEFIGRAVGQLEQQGVEVFDVSAEAEEAWTQAIVDSFIDGSAVMSACTPSRINNEGHPEALNPRNGNYGRRFGDWFAYRDRLEQWLEAGTFEGLELDIRSPVS
jgi:cyclohexanone monooxygenase/pentalenolactone D synthase